MLNDTGANFRTGTIYIGDIGKTEGALEVTGAIFSATSTIVNSEISEIDVTIEESDYIPLMFFSIKNTSENTESANITIIVLKNQTSSNVKIQVNKNTGNAVDITLNVLIVKPGMI